MSYKVAKFSQNLITQVNKDQRLLIKHFENFKSNNIVYLTNDDFKHGTYRIRDSGVYILKEDIIFHPNPENDFFPTPQQIMSHQYPVDNGGAYFLGFFAAITVETEDVIIDFNGKSINQSDEHKLEQRFYAHIELASSPFIPNQGPGSFSTVTTYNAANRTLICNGTMGKSSHHGIHGNGMTNIILDNLIFHDFEVAAVSLNGSINSILCNLDLLHNSQNVPILSPYSQARFIRQFLNRLPKTAYLTVNGQKRTLKMIKDNLNKALKKAKNEILNTGKTTDPLFNNKTKLPDGNAYGIVLAGTGVIINDFIRTRDSKNNNENIFLKNIKIKNIITHPKEVIGINTCPEDDGAYGKKLQSGPAGDIIRIEEITQNKSNLGVSNLVYKPNVLSDAQMIIAKYNTPKIGTTSICDEIVKWVEEKGDLLSLMSSESDHHSDDSEDDENHFYFRNGFDSMGHTMKGNIGLFISGGHNIKGNRIVIENIWTKGTEIGESPLMENSPDKKLNGATATGFLTTCSHNIDLNIRFNKINSEKSEELERKIYLIESDNIFINKVEYYNNE